MNKSFIVLAMLFCHIFADFNLQGWLANGKQKKFWEDNASESMYKYDYIIALIMHSIEWTFLVMLPIAIYKKFNIDITFICLFIINVATHSCIDHAKANQHSINLWVDQFFHIIQIAITALSLWR